MDDSAKKALDFISQAEKKLKSSTGFLGNLMGWVLLLMNDLSDKNIMHISVYVCVRIQIKLD